MEISELTVGCKASFSASELDDACALVREASWNQVPADWAIFLAHGQVHAVQTATGRIVATTATLPYAAASLPRAPARAEAGFAWISMVLVAGPYRRRGLATQLMRRAMDDLAGRSLVAVLDATPEGRAVYRALGFHDCWGFHRLLRRERSAVAPPAVPAAGATVRPLRDGDWRALCDYDARAFGAARTQVLGRLRGRLPSAELVAERDGRLIGFLLGRDGRVAAQLGPLIAEDDTVACALMAHALGLFAGPLFTDVADAKTALNDFLAACGFIPVRPLTRMLHGRSTRFDDAARTYAVIGPEFG
ncbi:MAG TPA: GNAT family N-acetyltransferase [Xanthobacteraceae bacterium]|jgi:GNAT superfamily N-acetyltransferase